MTSATVQPTKLTVGLLAAGLLIAAPMALALDDDNGHDDHGHDDESSRQFGAHVHGAAQLLVALDHDHVTVMLESPSINIVGFEHYARNDTDRHALQNVADLLANPANVFTLASAAQCSLEQSHIRSEQLAEMHGEADHDDHNDHNHDEHGHDEHGHDEHNDHGHDDHDHSNVSTHSEFHVEYEFHCDSPERLTSLQVSAFNHFSGFESVDVQWILDGQQGAFRSQPGTVNVSF